MGRPILDPIGMPSYEQSHQAPIMNLSTWYCSVYHLFLFFILFYLARSGGMGQYTVSQYHTGLTGNWNLGINQNLLDNHQNYHSSISVNSCWQLDLSKCPFFKWKRVTFMVSPLASSFYTFLPNQYLQYTWSYWHKVLIDKWTMLKLEKEMCEEDCVRYLKKPTKSRVRLNVNLNRLTPNIWTWLLWWYLLNGISKSMIVGETLLN